MNSVAVSIIVLGFASSVLVTGGEIRGKVCVTKSGTTECVKDLDSVRICCYVPGETDSIIGWTDSLGKYRIPIEEPPGRKSLIVSKVGYETKFIEGVIVSENKTTYVYTIDLVHSK